MKKLVFVVLCLFLAGCGTFAIKVEIVARGTQTDPPGASLTHAWATTYAAATAYSADPQGQSPLLTQAAATMQAAYSSGSQSQSRLLTPAASTPQPENLPATASPTPTLVQATPTPWALQDGVSISLATIEMSDISHGWGIESTGHVVRTGDGGWTWQDVTPVEALFDRHGLYAFNDETVWVVPSNLRATNVVWITRDGGVTWEASQPIQLGDAEYSPLALQFPDARHGWLLVLSHGGSQGSHVLLFKSTNAGMDWVPVSSLDDSQMQSYLPATNTSMVFFDGQTGWLGGWWGKDDPNQWLILKTVDGGAHWGTDELPLPKLNALSCNGHPVAELQPGTMAVEMSCTLPNDPKYLFHHIYYLSTRITPSWRSWELSGNFLSADFLNPSQGWMMVGSDTPRLNEIQSTKDRGKIWAPIGEVSWQQARFDFVDVKDGWAVVGNGYGTALVRTENGGKIWIQVRPVAGR